jgi:hypothetical protein
MIYDVQPDVIVGPPAADRDVEAQTAIRDAEAFEAMADDVGFPVSNMAAMEILRTVARWRYSVGV